MNLIHLLAKNDKNLSLAGEVTPLKLRIGEHTYTGLRLGPGAGLRLKRVLRWYPFNTRPVTPGWMLLRDEVKWPRTPDAAVDVSLVTPAGDRLALSDIRPALVPQSIILPYLDQRMAFEEALELDLEVRNTASRDPVTLLVTENLPTEKLYASAKGTGLELGPGPNPRLFNTAERTVFYVEREPAQEWFAKYAIAGKSLDKTQGYWDQYKIGLGHDLPCDDDSLDFIFSSDVFEHLVNPLGHLQYWRRKLKPGGRLIKIIPYIAGCSDYRARPTDFSWWMEQYERGGFVETTEHYRPYALSRGLNADELLEKQVSVHFSFFELSNLARMLEFAVANLGYTGFSVQHALNSKKIHFTLDC